LGPGGYGLRRLSNPHRLSANQTGPQCVCVPGFGSRIHGTVDEVPENARKEVLESLLEADRLVLTTHIRPDGDALGSEIGLALFLQKLGKQVWILNSDPPPANLDWLVEFFPVKTFTGSLKQLKLITEADALVIIDTGALERLGKVGVPLRNGSGRKILIDHHPSPETWFDLAYLETTFASTGEMIYDIIAGHDADLIDGEIATALYAAIMTDTGSFRYGATTARTHRIVADLMERGDISPEPIHISIFDNRQMSGIRLLARALDTITPVYDGQIAYAVISMNALDASGARSDEAEGVVSYPLSLEGVRAVVQFLETTNGIKCSFRSKGDVAVNKWARRFGGGGHRNAAGAYISGKSLKEVIDEVIAAAPRYLDLGEEYEAKDELSDEDRALLASFQGKL
jgi:bifunctional oligoribonuclease and PAP phosphatase NrnA